MGSEATGSLQVWVDIIICHWLFSGKCMVRDCKFGTRTLYQKTDNRVHVSICSLQNVPFPLLPRTFTEPFLFATKPVLSYEILGLTTLHAPVPCSFKFTHPPVLSALLLILPASRFLVADFPLLVPVPFSVSAPHHWRTSPFLSVVACRLHWKFIFAILCHLSFWCHCKAQWAISDAKAISSSSSYQSSLLKVEICGRLPSMHEVGSF